MSTPPPGFWPIGRYFSGGITLYLQSFFIIENNSIQAHYLRQVFLRNSRCAYSSARTHGFCSSPVQSFSCLSSASPWRSCVFRPWPFTSVYILFKSQIYTFFLYDQLIFCVNCASFGVRSSSLQSKVIYFPPMLLFHYVIRCGDWIHVTMVNTSGCHGNSVLLTYWKPHVSPPFNVQKLAWNKNENSGNIITLNPELKEMLLKHVYGDQANYMFKHPHPERNSQTGGSKVVWWHGPTHTYRDRGSIFALHKVMK